jgi:putative membrane protein
MQAIALASALLISAAALNAQGIPRAEIVLDDSFILGVRASVDQAEIETAQWAARHAARKDIRDFAQSLLRGHSSAQNAAKNIAAQLKVDLKIRKDTSDAIARRAAVAQAQLRKLSGRKFDQAFLTAIRDEHTSEIDKVNNWYASAAASDSVKAYLHTIMPTLIKHQQTAEKLLAVK